MNYIAAKEIESFGRKIVSIHIDDVPIDKLLCDLTGNSDYRDLWCAWLLNNHENDSRYVWSLLNEKRECNLPILLCPDDMDFWCTVIVAQVRFFEDTVSWNKIGAVTEKIDTIKWQESGIKDISSWSDADWKKYGDSLSFLNADDKLWEQWCSENWPDEENRRIWNYFHRWCSDLDVRIVHRSSLFRSWPSRWNLRCKK